MNQRNISLSILVDNERLSRRDSIPEEIEEIELAQSLSKGVARKQSKSKMLNKSRSNLLQEKEHRKSWHSDDNNPT